RIGQSQKSPGNAERAGAAIGFEDVAIDRNSPFAEGVQIDDRAEAAADQALNFGGAAVEFAFPFAPFARAGAAGEHVVFGRDPAAAFALHPVGHFFFDAGRAEDGRAAGLNPDAAGRGPRVATFDFDRAKFVAAATIGARHGGG